MLPEALTVLLDGLSLSGESVLISLELSALLVSALSLPHESSIELIVSAGASVEGSLCVSLLVLVELNPLHLLLCLSDLFWSSGLLHGILGFPLLLLEVFVGLLVNLSVTFVGLVVLVVGLSLASGLLHVFSVLSSTLGHLVLVSSDSLVELSESLVLVEHGFVSADTSSLASELVALSFGQLPLLVVGTVELILFLDALLIDLLGLSDGVASSLGLLPQVGSFFVICSVAGVLPSSISLGLRLISGSAGLVEGFFVLVSLLGGLVEGILGLSGLVLILLVGLPKLAQGPVVPLVHTFESLSIRGA